MFCLFVSVSVVMGGLLLPLLLDLVLSALSSVSVSFLMNLAAPPLIVCSQVYLPALGACVLVQYLLFE
jgi:hypothetical protein